MVSVVLVLISVVSFVCSFYTRQKLADGVDCNKFKKLSVFSIVCTVASVLLLISNLFYGSTYTTISDSLYVKDLESSDDAILYDVYRDIRNKYPDAEEYDIVDIKKRKDLSNFEKFLSNFYCSKDYLEYSVKLGNTGTEEAWGSDLSQVSQSSADEYGIVRENLYIKYNNCFYEVTNKVDIDDGIEYVIKYSKESAGTISDLSVSFKKYSDCLIEELDN